MGILVLAAALLALAFPDALQKIRPTVINYMLGVVMFGMGLTLNLRDFKIVFSRPKDVIIGCLAQFTVMPLLAWGLTRIFSLDEALALGVVLVGCCPGGTASNVITYLAKGDLALSVGMTGVSTLFAPFLTPLLTWALAGKSVNVDIAGMLLSILWVVILPIVVGLVVKWLWPKFTEEATDYLPAFSSIVISLIVAIVISANANKLLAGGLIIVLVVILHNLCGLILGYLVGCTLGLPEAKKRAISIEVGMQNSGLASSLATIHFAAYPLATIPGAIFSVWHNLSGAAVAYLYRKKNNPPTSQKKILFLHGFYASGSCAPALALREAFNGRATVLTPDLPLHPADAVRLIQDICDKEKPDILVGNSCGAFYAQMIAPTVGAPALLGNPHFKMSEFLRERIGNHQYNSPRADGKQNFTIDERLVSEFEEMETRQFSDEIGNEYLYYKDRVWGIFGEQDTLAHFEPLFLEHYTHSYHFPGGHTPTAEQFKTWYCPLIEKLLLEY